MIHRKFFVVLKSRIIIIVISLSADKVKLIKVGKQTIKSEIFVDEGKKSLQSFSKYLVLTYEVE